jgi:hypothetical protein
MSDYYDTPQPQREFGIYRPLNKGKLLDRGQPGRERARLKLPLARVPRPYFGDGLDDQRLQHRLVHISEFLDVEAALANGVPAELGEQRL